MKKLDQRGQVAIGIIIIIGVVAFILLNNLQTQQNLMSRQILEARSKMEMENAIDLFGKELYKAYVLAAPVAETFDKAGRMPANAHTSTPPILDFYISPDSNNKKTICLNRIVDKVNNTNKPICILLPDAFLTWLDLQQSSNPDLHYAKNELLNYLLGVQPTHAQISKFPFGSPDPNIIPIVKTTIAASTNQLAFAEEYENFNCLSPDTTLKCVTIRICIRPSGCPAKDDSDKVIQSFVFTQVPNSQLRE